MSMYSIGIGDFLVVTSCSEKSLVLGARPRSGQLQGVQHIEVARPASTHDLVIPDKNAIAELGAKLRYLLNVFLP